MVTTWIWKLNSRTFQDFQRHFYIFFQGNWTDISSTFPGYRTKNHQYYWSSRTKIHPKLIIHSIELIGTNISICVCFSLYMNDSFKALPFIAILRCDLLSINAVSKKVAYHFTSLFANKSKDSFSFWHVFFLA